MPSPRPNPAQEPCVGYLAPVHSAEHGYFGGYLIVSKLGRPLEFHCTSPVRPSRAQEILYGPTLQPYLLGEEIGQALLAAAKLRPRVVLTNSDAVLHIRAKAEPPIAMLKGPATTLAADASTFGDSIASSSTDFNGHMELGGYEIQLPIIYEADYAAIRDVLKLLAEHVDLAEPFGRIQEAILEAQRIGGRAAGVHDAAA